MKETKLTISNKKMKVDLPLVENLPAPRANPAPVSNPSDPESIAPDPVTLEPTQVTVPLRAVVYDANTKQLALGTLGDATFDGNRQITAAGFPNVTAGGTTVGQFLNNLLFPALGPVASIAIADPTRQRGDTRNLDYSWTVTKRTSPIGFIEVEGIDQAVTGETQSGTSATLFGAVSVYITASDINQLISSASALVSYHDYRFWFQSGIDFLGATDGDISAFLTLNASKDFAGARQQSRTFTLADEYNYFAYEDSLGAASFVVGGLPNTAYQLHSFAYTNSHGYTINYRLYRSGGKGTGTIGVTIN